MMMMMMMMTEKDIKISQSRILLQWQCEQNYDRQKGLSDHDWFHQNSRSRTLQSWTNGQKYTTASVT